jgi:hypothetical protein
MIGKSNTGAWLSVVTSTFSLFTFMHQFYTLRGFKRKQWRMQNLWAAVVWVCYRQRASFVKDTFTVISSALRPLSTIFSAYRRCDMVWYERSVHPSASRLFFCQEIWIEKRATEDSVCSPKLTMWTLWCTQVPVFNILNRDGRGVHMLVSLLENIPSLYVGGYNSRENVREMLCENILRLTAFGK